jgi:hypothetical protein
MGAYLSQPNTEKHSEDGEGPGSLRYGVSEMQGWRMHMEVRAVGVCRAASATALARASAAALRRSRVPRAHPAHSTHVRGRMLTSPSPS